MRFSVKYFLCLMLVFSGISSAHAQYDKDVFLWRGQQALMDGKYALAIENFNVLARLDTTDHMTYFYRGIAKYDLGDLRGAYADFNNSVRLNPVFTSGYHYRAITQSRIGHYDAALADLQTAINLRPGFIGLYYSRGVTYFLAQQFSHAVADFDYYIKKEPKDPSGYLNRGASYLFLGDTVKAFSDYNKALKLDRFDPEGYMRRGRLYFEQGDMENALLDMNKTIELDSTNTLAYFNRAIMCYEMHDYNSAMRDLNRVLQDEPGNALTLYNRGLISAQVGNFEDALSDMDRVLNINPNNVLAYFNRASIFIEMERYEDALEDFNRAIELYPDFAKAYMNRSYVENMLGDMKASKADYQTALRKVAEYRARNETDAGSFADTTKKYSSLLTLDAEFAKKDFDDELLQHRDIDIKLRPLYRYVLSQSRNDVTYALERRYENPLMAKFEQVVPVSVSMANTDTLWNTALNPQLEQTLYGSNTALSGVSLDLNNFCRALLECTSNHFNSALSYYDGAIETEQDGLAALYKAFYLMNRGALRSEMIDFIAAIENNVQVLSMDDNGKARARVKDSANQQYDYSEAISDMEQAVETVKDIPYFHFNLGNLYCLASEHIRSIESYSKAIELYPYMGDAYFNRGLVLIYLKDKEKGCIDLSRAGELGVVDAYGVIKKYCEEERAQ